ncbi:MAG: iron-containing alcohol dehydrogenase, partial [Bryobacterales bacterium]|nr:iron-containing alcohol dehydrogenase [Bryobacterales bacterium]
GAGAEVTRNAVLASPQHRVKASLRSAHMLPRLAIVDPDLTLGLPPSVTAATGLDALTQLIEPYVSSRANAFTGMLCLEGIRQATAHLRQAFHNPADRHARIAMAQASLYSGMALANAGLGAVHGFAAPIGGMYPAPHGAVCAALLPHVIRVNLQALEARQPQSPSISRYRTVLEITGGLQWIEETCRQLEIPPLSAYGIAPEHYPDITAKAAQAGSMKANPISLTAAELTAILQLAA